MSLDIRALRHALGLYTTGVTIITTRTPDNGGHTGVTVNSFTSVSLDPPLVLFCLSNWSTLLDAFVASEHFAVNVLAKGQQELSNRFARPSLNDWHGVKYRESEHGCAILASTLGSLECRRRAVYQGGDHAILVGEVRRFDIAAAAEPLVFYRGSYGTVARDQSGVTLQPDNALADLMSHWG